MMAALFTSLFLALFPDLRDHSVTIAIYYKLYQSVDREIEHKEDREEIKTIFKDLKAHAKVYSKKEAILRKEFWIIDQNYNSTIDDYNTILDSLEALIRDSESQLLHARTAIKEHLTKEQWENGYLDINRYIEKSLKRVRTKMAEPPEDAEERGE